MSDDLLNDLRWRGSDDPLAQKAADEIERLRSENAKWKETYEAACANRALMRDASRTITPAMIERAAEVMPKFIPYNATVMTWRRMAEAALKAALEGK